MRGLISTLVLVLLFGLGASSFASGLPSKGLLVTFDVRGELFQSLVTKPESMQYVLSYIHGQAPRIAPTGEVLSGASFNSDLDWHFADESVVFENNTKPCTTAPEVLPSQIHPSQGYAGTTYCPASAKIVRVQDCRDGTCVTLRGLYAGRSPAF